MTPLRETVSEGIITRGDSLPSPHTHEEAMGSRLMTAYRQGGFGSVDALFTTRKPLCLTRFSGTIVQLA